MQPPAIPRHQRLVPVVFFSCVVWLFFVAAAARATTFQKDDQVVLVRDEPMRLYQEPKATGKKGQVFSVLAYTPADRRIYVLYKDVAGKSSSLNVPEDAVLLLPGRGDAAFRQGLGNLQAGLWMDAARNFASAVAAEPDELLYADVKSRTDSLLRSLAAVQQAKVAADQAATAAKQKRRNADMSDHENSLVPGDRSGEVRAANDRAAAKEIEAAAKENVKTAEHNLEGAVVELAGYARQKVTTKDFDVAMALASACQRLVDTGSRSSVLDDAAGRLAEAQALADTRRDAAARDLAAGRLYTANKEITEGLAAVPTHRSLKALQIQTGLRLAGIEEGVAKADAAQKKADHEGALRLVNALLAECPDDPNLQKRKTLLEETIAARDSAIAGADSAEKAHEYGKALEVYEIYGRRDAVARVLPLVAKQEEDSGNFIHAVELYRRAGLEGEAARLKQQRQEQEDAYTAARVALAENHYDAALATYARYKDNIARRAALKEKAAHLMAGNDFDGALQTYRDAGAAEEIKSLLAVIDERKQALAEAKDMEAAARYDEALALYAKGSSTADVSRLAHKLADAALAKKDYETAVRFFEMAGDYAKAGQVRAANHVAETSSFKKLEPQEIYQKCLSATVTVFVDDALGSGFFVAKGGYILTNAHVVEDASKVEVRTSDGKTLPGRVLAKTKVPDLALVKVDTNDNPCLTLADSSKVVPGQTVYAIGTPEDAHLAGSFSQGMVSKTGLLFEDNHVFQMTVLINHGNSGGPLLDEKGRVVGIATFVLGTAAVLRDGTHIGSDVQGINFAIEVNEARQLMEANIRPAK